MSNGSWIGVKCLASSAPWLVKFSDSYITNNTVYVYIYQYYTCVRVDHARNLSIYESASWLLEGHVRTKEPTWILFTILLRTWASSHYFPVIRYLCDSVLPHYCIIYVCAHGLHIWSTATLRTRAEQSLQKWIVTMETAWLDILAGKLFWRIGGFESNPPNFICQKLQCDVIVIAES